MIDWQTKETLKHDNVKKLVYVFYQPNLQYTEIAFFDGKWWRGVNGIIDEAFIICWARLQAPDTKPYENEEWYNQERFKGGRPSSIEESIPNVLPVTECRNRIDRTPK